MTSFATTAAKHEPAFLPVTFPRLAEMPPPPGSPLVNFQEDRTFSQDFPQETGSLWFTTFLPKLVTVVIIL